MNAPNQLVMKKAVFTQDHYSYFYYIRQLFPELFPDILYSQPSDGEILVEWNDKSH